MPKQGRAPQWSSSYYAAAALYAERELDEIIAALEGLRMRVERMRGRIRQFAMASEDLAALEQETGRQEVAHA